MELKEEYGHIYKELGECIDERDVVEYLDKLNRSREYCYIDEKGFGTYDPNEAKVMSVVEAKDGKWNEVEAKYTVELGIRNVTPIDVICKAYIHFDDDGEVDMENLEAIGWE